MIDRAAGTSRLLQAYALLTSPLAVAVLLWWLSVHVLGGMTMAWPLVVYGAVLLARPQWWLVILPALWPVADLARWTGQIHVTESDALLLTTVAALGVRAVIGKAVAPPQTPDRRFRAGLAAWSSMIAVGTTAMLSIVRGMNEIPPVSFDAWTGYSGSMNAIRVGKGFLLPILLLPYLQAALSRDGIGTFRQLSTGLALGFGVASLAALWERLAFPGLTDFASDYRTTALFWEMHVGGAALDGWLALTLPFALYAAWSHRQSPVPTALFLGSLALGSYAILTTFSRGLYLGVVVIAVTMAICAFATRDRGSAGVGRSGLLGLGAALLGALGVALLAFAHGGYRGAAAMLGAAILAYMLAPRCRGMSHGGILVGLALGLAVAVPVAWVAHQVPKGPYAVFGLAWFAGLGLSFWRTGERPMRGIGLLSLATFVWVLYAAVAVAVHWGGNGALPGGVLAAVLVAIPTMAQSATQRVLWTPDRRGLAAAAVAGVACLISAAVLGSYYFHSRTETTVVDLEGRFVHWGHSVSLITNEEQRWLGIGAGRFSEAYFWNVPSGQFPGTWRIVTGDDGNTFLRLGPPRHVRGFGELFRLTQPAPLDVRGPFAYRLRARTNVETELRFEVCRKHLLYTHDCVMQGMRVKAGDEWQTFDGVTVAEPGALNPGPWYAPRLATFALDLDGNGAVDVDDIEIIDGLGRPLVRNGYFNRGPASWFFSSDRHHLPWHAKNIALHAYIESGIVGVVALAAAFVLAIGRLIRRFRSGSGAMAGALLASLLAILVVGLFDSLIDVPRLSVWLLMILWASLTIRRTPPK